MARTEARVFSSVWQDDDFLALSRSAHGTYFFLLSQPELSYCGVIPLRLARWVRRAAGFTLADLEADLKELASGERPLIVIDEVAGELLVRSLIRVDGVWKQPNLLKSARESAALVESLEIKTVMLCELRRLPIEESSSDLVRRVLGDFIEDLEGPCENPSRKGSGIPSGIPSQGKGGGNGSSETEPLTPETLSSSEAAPPTHDLNEGREDVDRLCVHLADRIEANGSKRPAITKTWRDAARLLIDADKRPEERIHLAIDWCQGDEFWRGKVMSMPKLREKYDQLRLEAQRQQATRDPTGFGAQKTNIRPQDEWMHRR